VTRKVLFGLLVLALVGETLFFARQTRAGLLELRGQRAFFRNDLAGAWKRAGEAVAAGGPRGRLETRRLEVLLAAFHLKDVGIHDALPLDDAAAETEARRLLGRRLRDTPHQARLWSLAADLFFHEARVERRSTPLDLSRLSEDPMENLLPADRLGLSALEKAATLESSNYLYHALLAEQFLEFGSEANAARAARASVAAYPRLDAHIYLSGVDRPPALVQAALDGYQDALLSVSLVARVEILRDAARLLTRNHRDEEAIRFLDLAAKLDPGYVDARFDLALARIRLGQWKEAERDLEIAIPLLPDWSPLHIVHARVLRQLGDGEGAIEAWRRARVLSTDTRVFVEFGDLLESMNRTDEARRQFHAAVNINPTDPDAWIGLLRFARRHDEKNDVARACEQLLRSPEVRDDVRSLCADPRRAER
jgi:tetratricopeptide (TPR) repeat protein